MAKKQAEAGDVKTYIEKIEQPLRDLVWAVRNVILETDAEIGEQVKWNSPAFYYTGDMKPFDPKEYKRDIAVMNLRRGYVLLVLPTGARIHDKPGILEGSYSDGRRMMSIKNPVELELKKTGLQHIIRAWLDTVDR